MKPGEVLDLRIVRTQDGFIIIVGKDYFAASSLLLNRRQLIRRLGEILDKDGK